MAIIEIDWLNYPGFEAWRFVNLALFILGAAYLHRRFGRPINQALQARATRIKSELLAAREKRKLASSQLQEIQSRLSQVQLEVTKIQSEADRDAQAEQNRIRAHTQTEVANLRAQADREIERLVKGTELQLKRFAAHEGVALAASLIRGELQPPDDARLISIAADKFGGSQH